MSMDTYKKNLTEILEWVAVASLTLIIILRVYAAFMTQPALSHDDIHYRSVASYLEPKVTLRQALINSFLPTTFNIGHRTAGYHSSLVMAIKIFKKFLEYERIYQIGNLVWFVFQVVFMYLLSFWASKKQWFALSMTFLYLSMPIVFGMNRWVMTENFVFPAILSFGYFSVWLVTTRSVPGAGGKKDIIIKEILVPVVAAYCMGVFSTVREYALPVMIALGLGAMMGLIIQKRWLALSVFTLVFTPYAVAGVQGALPIIRNTLLKTGLSQTNYDWRVKFLRKPLHVWYYQMIVHSAGIAMTILLLSGVTGIFYAAYSRVVPLVKNGKIELLKFIRSNFTGVNIVFICQVFMTVFYWVGASMAKAKFHRTTILPIVMLLISLLMSIRVFNISLEKIAVKVKLFLMSMILISWIVMGYQLFFAFDGGKSFVVIPYKMPTYNHPMHLRKLRGVGDWHVIEDEELMKEIRGK